MTIGKEVKFRRLKKKGTEYPFEVEILYLRVCGVHHIHLFYLISCEEI